MPQYLDSTWFTFGLQKRFGEAGAYAGITIYVVLLLVMVYMYVGGNKKALIENTDIKGKKYSWRNTILGLIIFIISIPIVIYLSLRLHGFL